MWVPLFMIIEVVFAAGVTLAISSIIIQMRDLLQVLPHHHLAGPVRHPGDLALLEDPEGVHVAGGHHVHRSVVDGHLVTAAHWVGGITINLQMVYGFFNPLGPIIDDARRTMLLALAPDWPRSASPCSDRSSTSSSATGSSSGWR